MTRAEAERLDRIEAKLDEIDAFGRAQVRLAEQQIKLAEQHAEFLSRLLQVVAGKPERPEHGRRQVTGRTRHLSLIREE